MTLMVTFVYRLSVEIDNHQNFFFTTSCQYRRAVWGMEIFNTNNIAEINIAG